MYYADHAPPQLHAIYGEDEAIADIPTGAVIGGELPRRAGKLVAEWIASHQNELLDNWERARNRQPLLPIAPLD